MNAKSRQHAFKLTRVPNYGPSARGQGDGKGVLGMFHIHLLHVQRTADSRWARIPGQQDPETCLQG
jgi:hypothetical protein